MKPYCEHCTKIPIFDAFLSFCYRATRAVKPMMSQYAVNDSVSAFVVSPVSLKYTAAFVKR